LWGVDVIKLGVGRGILRWCDGVMVLQRRETRGWKTRRRKNWKEDWEWRVGVGARKEERD